MELSKRALGFLKRRYSVVLKKNYMLNTFGALALASAMVVGGAGLAAAASVTVSTNADWAKVQNGDDVTLGGAVTAPVNTLELNSLTLNGHELELPEGQNAKNLIVKVLNVNPDDNTTTVTDIRNDIYLGDAVNAPLPGPNNRGWLVFNEIHEANKLHVKGTFIINDRDFSIPGAFGVGNDSEAKGNFQVIADNLNFYGGSGKKGFNAGSLYIHGDNVELDSTADESSATARFDNAEVGNKSSLQSVTLVGGAGSNAYKGGDAVLHLVDTNLETNALSMEHGAGGNMGGQAYVKIEANSAMNVRGQYTTSANKIVAFADADTTGEIGLDSPYATVSFDKLTLDGGGVAQTLSTGGGRVNANSLVVLNGEAANASKLTLAGFTNLTVGKLEASVIDVTGESTLTSAGSTKAAINVSGKSTLRLQSGSLDASAGLNMSADTKLNTESNTTLTVSNAAIGANAAGAAEGSATIESTTQNVSGNVIITGFNATLDYDRTAGSAYTNLQSLADATFGSNVQGYSFEGITLDLTGQTLNTVAGDKNLGKYSVDIGTGTVGNSESAVVGAVSGTGELTVASGGSLTITGKATDASGQLTPAGITNDGDVTLGAGKVGADGAGAVKNTGGTLNIEGEGTVMGSLEVTGGNVNVGNQGTKGTLVVTGETSLGGKTLFLDPAWINGVGIEGASSGALAKFTGGAIDGNLVAGQNSYVVLGASDTAWAQEAFKNSGLIWGENNVTAALFINSAQSLDTAKGGVAVNGTLTSGTPLPIAVNSANFAPNSLLVVNAANLGTSAALSATGGTLALDNTAKLLISGGTNAQVVTVVDGFTGLDNSTSTGWGIADVKQNLHTDSLLIGIDSTSYNHTSGNYSVTLKQLASANPYLDSQSNQLLDEVQTKYHGDVNHSNKGVAYLSRITNTAYLGDTAKVDDKTRAKEIISSRQLGTAGAAAASGLSAAQASSGAIMNRNSLTGMGANAQEGTAVAMVDGTVGLNAGNTMKSGFGLWLMPLYKWNNVHGVDSGSLEGGYTTSLGGIALGADYTIQDAVRVGLAFNVGGGTAESTGDFNDTTNSFSFWGLSLYAGYQKNNFGLSLDAGYTGIYGDISQETHDLMQWGDNEADTHTDVWTVGLNAEYVFNAGFMDITPHAGVRYYGVRTYGYDVEGNGGTIASVSEDFQGVWQFPVGVTLSADVAMSNGWTFTPKMDVGFIASAGDFEASAKSSTAGLNTVTEYTMKNVDGFAFNGGLGFDIANENLSLGLNYNIQASEHQTGHMIFADFRYDF